MTYTGVLSFGSAIIRSAVLKVNSVAESITPIGEIDSARYSSDSTLEMSAAISSFTSDADFGPWPPPSGWIQIAATTNYLYTVMGSTTQYVVDETKIGKYYNKSFNAPVAYKYTIGVNTAPVLSTPSVYATYFRSLDPFSPDSISIIYTDIDNNPPTIARVTVGGVPYNMVTRDHRYSDGALFKCEVPGTIPYGTSISFYFYDGMAAATMDLAMEVKETGAMMPEEFGISSVSPNPFNSSVRIDFSLFNPSPCNLRIYDQNGRLVESIVEGERINDGGLSLNWQPSKDVKSGIYFAVLEQSGYTSTKRLVYIR
jgi:hypothetical protein